MLQNYLGTNYFILLYRVASVLQQAVLSNNKDIKGISLLITINLFMCKLHL